MSGDYIVFVLFKPNLKDFISELQHKEIILPECSNPAFMAVEIHNAFEISSRYAKLKSYCMDNIEKLQEAQKKSIQMEKSNVSINNKEIPIVIPQKSIEAMIKAIRSKMDTLKDVKKTSPFPNRIQPNVYAFVVMLDNIYKYYIGKRRRTKEYEIEDKTKDFWILKVLAFYRIETEEPETIDSNIAKIRKILQRAKENSQDFELVQNEVLRVRKIVQTKEKDRIELLQVE